ncbi:DUF2927 domain-containing protein [Flagellimonas pacifica]|uniref:Peptidase M10 metallopeptidase domain-containing protein n=1 Tax=Flagellimonas pacifica TaxID=1247520 RepID=A0A285MXX0_9FLAO|nr:DUF2927 domain-containing protein [Allomuricauda parva]SNZ02035.1 Protein of unknown function [Allomuricauda parva]
MKRILVFVLSCLLVTSCTKDDDSEKDLAKELSEQQKEFVKEYKHVVVDDLNLKWKKEIKLFLDGTITTDYEDMVKNTLATFNNFFSDGMKITLVNTLAESNVHLYNGPKSEIANLWPDIYNAIGDSDVGYGSSSWFSNSAEGEKLIDSGRVWVNQNTGMPLFSHELGHVLGLGHSSQKYCGSSIMCSVPAQEFSSFDIAMMKILYHPQIKSGATFEEIESIVTKLLLSNEISF